MASVMSFDEAWSILQEEAREREREMASLKNVRTFDEAWPILQEEAINPLIASFEIEEGRHNFSLKEISRFCTLVRKLASRASNPMSYRHEAQKLYNQYIITFQDYISSEVLPSLRLRVRVRGIINNNNNEHVLLREFWRRWCNNITMTTWLSRFFGYLSSFYIPKMGLLPLVQTSQIIFYNMVIGGIKDQVIDAIISLVNKEREGEQIDQALVKNALDIFKNISKNVLKYYDRHQRRRASIQGLDDRMMSYELYNKVIFGEDALEDHSKDIEQALVEATAIFYSNKALHWINDDTDSSYDNYMLKVEESLEKEKGRVEGYLMLTNKNKVLEVALHELVNVHATKLEEKKASNP